MSSKMLIEVRSELEIDATVLASKWSDIHLLMVLKKVNTYVRLKMESQVGHPVGIFPTNVFPTNEWALLWAWVIALKKDKNEL